MRNFIKKMVSLTCFLAIGTSGLHAEGESAAVPTVNLEKSNAKKSTYVVDDTLLAERGYFDKLDLGETIGTDKLIDVETSDLKSRSQKLPQNAGDFVVWGAEKARQRGAAINQMQVNVDADFAAKNDSARASAGNALGNPKKTVDMAGFRRCALDTLPKLKSLLGLSLQQNRKEAVRYYLRIAERTGQSYSNLTRGELVCGNLLGELSFVLKSRDEITTLTEEILVLSTLLRFDQISANAQRSMLVALWANYHAGSTLQQEAFWNQYWQYVSAEAVLSPRPFILPPPADLEKTGVEAFHRFLADRAVLFPAGVKL